MEQYHTIPFIQPRLTLSSSLAIVGSSGRLLNESYGEEIDEHTHVVRFNRATTEGFEDKCGSKTTLRVVSDHVAKSQRYVRDGIEQSNRYLVKNLKNSNLLLICLPNTYQERYKYIDKSNSICFVSQGDIPQIQTIFGYKSGKSLTNGVFMVLLCVAAGIVPDLYGFDFKPEDKRTHYFEKRGETVVCHDIEKEKEFLIQLYKDERAVLHE